MTTQSKKFDSTKFETLPSTTNWNLHRLTPAAHARTLADQQNAAARPDKPGRCACAIAPPARVVAVPHDPLMLRWLSRPRGVAGWPRRASG